MINKSKKFTNRYHHQLRLHHKTNPKRSNDNKKARTEKPGAIEGTGEKNAGQYHVIRGDERVVDSDQLDILALEGEWAT